MGHLIKAQLGIDPYNSTAAINVVRQYDDRGRILAEADGSSAANSAISATDTLTVTGSDGQHQVCTTIYVPEGPYHVLTPVTTCNAVPDTGTLSVTVNGFTSTASYANGTTDAAVAAQLTAGFNAPGSSVAAAQNGSTITLTADASGAAGDYAVSISNGDISVSAQSSSLTGGQNLVVPSGALYSYQVGSYAANGNSPTNSQETAFTRNSFVAGVE
jgi:hypothetical protein